MTVEAPGATSQPVDPRIDAAASALYEYYRLTEPDIDPTAPGWEDASVEHRTKGCVDLAVALAAADAVDPVRAELREARWLLQEAQAELVAFKPGSMLSQQCRDGKHAVTGAWRCHQCGLSVPMPTFVEVEVPESVRGREAGSTVRCEACASASCDLCPNRPSREAGCCCGDMGPEVEYDQPVAGSTEPATDRANDPEWWGLQATLAQAEHDRDYYMDRELVLQGQAGDMAEEIERLRAVSGNQDDQPGDPLTPAKSRPLPDHDGDITDDFGGRP